MQKKCDKFNFKLIADISSTRQKILNSSFFQLDF